MPPPPPPPSGNKPRQFGVLVILKGGPVGFRIPLRAQRLILGRSPAATIRVPDPSISRSHCSLVFNGSHWVVADLASSNGTFLNGQKVEQPTIAMPGDRLGVARVEFRIEYAAAAMVAMSVDLPDIEAELINDDIVVAELAMGIQSEPGKMKMIPVDPELQLEFDLESLPASDDDGFDWNIKSTINPDGR